jgi:hypothetical protein
MHKSGIKSSKIRCLADSYAAGELQVCIQDELREGANACLAVQDQSAAVAILSMAGFVRLQMEQDGLSVQQALRILGQRMRSLSARGSSA